MQTTIQKWGNSQAIRLPKAILEIAGVKENEKVQILAEENQIIIRKCEKKRRHKTLAERLEGFDGDYTGSEWDTGAPVGKEVW